jgi:hydroxymethylpyrimidine/phosphomethylpyrimidine kinase
VAAIDPSMVRMQAEQVANFFTIGAVKTGMLYSRAIIAEVAAFLLARQGLPAVVDPVMVSTSGAELLKPDAVDAMRRMLFPCAKIVTPNLDEVAVLTGSRPTDVAAMEQAAIVLAGQHGVPFLVKGGHLAGDSLVDVLAFPDGTTTRFTGARVAGVDTHGSGCTLSAAIAAQLALGLELGEAVAGAHGYIRDAIKTAIPVGGRRAINHFP